MDPFNSSLHKAEEIRSSLHASLAKGSDISARDMTALRGRMHQLRSLTAQLERVVMEGGSSAVNMTRRDQVLTLRRGVRRLERRLNGDDKDSSDDDMHATRHERSFGVDSQERQLGSLHNSIVNLKGVGAEISTEIESQVRLLSDLEKTHDFVLDKQGLLHSKFKSWSSSSAPNCTLYLMIAFLIIVLIASVVGL